jgi:DNA repair protein RadA
MEIFNPTQWAQLNEIDRKQAIKEIKRFRKAADVKLPNILKPSSSNLKNKPIPLLSNNFNALLGEGFCPGKIYLIYGAYATGKTQISFHTCVSLFNVYKDSKIPNFARFIDTENTFRSERIQEIARNGYKFVDDTVLTRIHQRTAGSTDSILLELKKLHQIGLNEETKVIIIDSLTKHIRLDLGNDEISNVQVRDKLKRILGYLHDITRKYGIVTILNSQVTGFTAHDSIFAERPIMEYVLNHYVDETIYLFRTENTRWAYLVNSNSLKSQKIEFTISASGIED